MKSFKLFIINDEVKIILKLKVYEKVYYSSSFTVKF